MRRRMEASVYNKLSPRRVVVTASAAPSTRAPMLYFPPGTRACYAVATRARLQLSQIKRRRHAFGLFSAIMSSI